MKSFLKGFWVFFAGLLLISLSSETWQNGQRIDLPNAMQETKSPAALKLVPDFGNVPLYFIPNQGQADKEALFYARASGYTLWMTKEGLVFEAIREEENQASEAGRERKYAKKSKAKISREEIFETQREAKFERDVSRLVFLNANKNVEVVSCETTEHRVNYFVGGDASQWRTDIPTSQAVLYKNIYKNIDLKIYGAEKQIEYDWVVKPGGKPEDIHFRYRGVKGTKIDGLGNLVIESRLGALRHQKPVSYQVIDGSRVEVEAEFELMGKDQYGFGLKEFNPAYDLIIDPLVLVYSTYLGGSGPESGRGIAVDSAGAIYVCGDTGSTNFPTKNPYQTAARGKREVFVAKFSPTGKTCIYSTYLGGSDDEVCWGIALDASAAVYLAGWTRSKNFPTMNAYQKTKHGKADVFVTKLAPTGKTLAYSTYLGGAGDDYGWRGIAVDSYGAAYITGYTNSTNFPTLNAYQKTNHGNSDVFVTKLAPTGKTLVYSTYLGGSQYEGSWGIAVDSSGAAYVTGQTMSANFPLKNPFQNKFGGGSQYDYDVFVTKLSPGGNTLIYSTYLGGSSDDAGHGIALDSSGAAYITGWAQSYNFPTKNPFQNNNHGSGDAFITKLSSTGKTLVYSTYLGGSMEDDGWGIAVDSSGAAYVAGWTHSTNFPKKAACQQTNRGDHDVFVTKLAPSGKTLVYSTYLGGSDTDDGLCIAIDVRGAASVTGVTKSLNFPLKNASQIVSRGDYEVFIIKLSFP